MEGHASDGLVKQRLDNGDYLIQFEAGEELALTLIKPLQGIMWPTPSLTRFYVATSDRKQKRDQEVAEQKRRLAQQHAKDTTKMLEQDREGRGARNCEQRELKFKKKAMAGAKKKEEQERGAKERQWTQKNDVALVENFVVVHWNLTGMESQATNTLSAFHRRLLHIDR